MAALRVLLVGYGDIARRVRQCLDAEYVAIRRQPQADEGCIAMDACDPAAMAALLATGFDQVLITLTPESRSDEGYQRGYVKPVDNILNALQAGAQRPQLFFVSSTSVYHQNDGSWVEEHSPTSPQHFSGIRLLEAEQRLADYQGDYVCLRLSGIYGPGRNKLIAQIARDEPISRAIDGFSNRIHADDAAAAIAHLMALSARGQPLQGCYLVSDSEPVALGVVVNELGRQLGKTLAHNECAQAGKKISNARLLATGFALQYPSWQHGYKALLPQWKETK